MYRTPSYDAPYEVEIWCTADKFADTPDTTVDDYLAGQYFTDIPVYYFQFDVDVIEGFDEIVVEYMYEFHPNVEAGFPYALYISLSNPRGESVELCLPGTKEFVNLLRSCKKSYKNVLQDSSMLSVLCCPLSIIISSEQGLSVALVE